MLILLFADAYFLRCVPSLDEAHRHLGVLLYSLLFDFIFLCRIPVVLSQIARSDNNFKIYRKGKKCVARIIIAMVIIRVCILSMHSQQTRMSIISINMLRNNYAMSVFGEYGIGPFGRFVNISFCRILPQNERMPFSKWIHFFLGSFHIFI